MKTGTSLTTETLLIYKLVHGIHLTNTLLGVVLLAVASLVYRHIQKSTRVRLVGQHTHRVL